MKQFIKPNRGHGPTPNPTMTVKELKDYLTTFFSDDAPVILCSEGMLGGLTPEYIKEWTCDMNLDLLESTVVIGDV